MRILLYGINYLPELTGIGKYTGEFSLWLSKRGHEVEVVTAPPYYPAWAVQEGYSSRKYTTENNQGVRIIRCPLWVPRNPSGIARIVHLISFATTSLPVIIFRAITKPPDIVLTVEPTFFCTLGGLIAAKLSRSCSWLHIQDFEIEAAIALGLVKNHSVATSATALETMVISRFDVVSTISPNMVRRLTERGIPESKVIHFPNWVDTNAVYPNPEEGAKLREELSIGPDTFVAAYSGNLGEKQGLEIIIDVANKLTSEENLLFIICGDGAAKARLQEKAQGLPNVRFLPLQPVEKLNGLLNLADVHLLPQKPGAADLVLPSKLTGILSSGKPVIATAENDTSLREVVIKAGGFVVPPNDPDSIARRLTELMRDHLGREASGSSARNYAVQHLSQDSILGRVEETMSKFL